MGSGQVGGRQVDSRLPAGDRPAVQAAYGGSAATPDTPRFEPGIHRFSCDRCHNRAEPPRDAAAWRATCTSAGCHPRAWTETVYHRVDPQVFVNCMNCHQPHVWRIKGTDCQGCHAPPDRSTGARPARALAVAAMAAFPHERHARYDCATCHATTTKHSSVTIKAPGDCEACHHGPPAAATCQTCHSAADRAGLRRESVAMRLSLATPIQQRSFAFDHQRHLSFACQSCHSQPYTAKPKVDCAGCHESHHRVGADCAACHNAPQAGVHPMSLHETGCQGSGCHELDPARSFSDSRALCLLCHAPQRDHQPGRNCAGCHLVSLGREPKAAP